MASAIELVDERNDLEVTFYGEPHTVDNGYDSGEAWGARYAAVVDTAISCEDTIEWDEKLYTKEQNEIIEVYLKANYDRIDKIICKKHDKERY